jgi:uncharacterized protein (TIGR02996 family)
LSDEAAFLNAILANPEDDAPRLVYADWLDERGDPASEAKAAFLRATASLALPGGRIRKWRRLCHSARELDDDWLAVVGKMPIEACPKVRCPRQWERLRPDSVRRARFCDQCRKTVHFCATADEARDRAWQGQPVVLHIGLVRQVSLGWARGSPRQDMTAAELADLAIEEFERERCDDRWGR